jgi:hypothetical protein
MCRSAAEMHEALEPRRDRLENANELAERAGHEQGFWVKSGQWKLTN